MGKLMCHVLTKTSPNKSWIMWVKVVRTGTWQCGRVLLKQFAESVTDARFRSRAGCAGEEATITEGTERCGTGHHSPKTHWCPRWHRPEDSGRLRRSSTVSSQTHQGDHTPRTHGEGGRASRPRRLHSSCALWARERSGKLVCSAARTRLQCVHCGDVVNTSSSLFLTDGVVTPFALSRFNDLTIGRDRLWPQPTLATTFFGHDLLWPRPALATTRPTCGDPKGSWPELVGGPRGGGPKVWGTRRGGREIRKQGAGEKGGGPKGWGPKPRKGGGPKGGGPEGWGSEGWGAWRVGGPKFRALFLSLVIFLSLFSLCLFSSLWGSSRGILVGTSNVLVFAPAEGGPAQGGAAECKNWIVNRGISWINRDIVRWCFRSFQDAWIINIGQSWKYTWFECTKTWATSDRTSSPQEEYEYACNQTNMRLIYRKERWHILIHQRERRSRIRWHSLTRLLDDSGSRSTWGEPSALSSGSQPPFARPCPYWSRLSSMTPHRQHSCTYRASILRSSICITEIRHSSICNLCWKNSIVIIEYRPV